MTKFFTFHQVAELGSSRGIEGGIKFIGKEEVFAFLLEKGVAFIKMKDGSPVPMYIGKAEKKGDYILYFNNVNTPEAAKELTGCQVLVEEKDYNDYLKEVVEEDGTAYGYLKGFLLKDRSSKFTSLIESVETYPQQEMALLESGHLVPLNDHFIKKVNKAEKVVETELPEGLFE